MDHIVRVSLPCHIDYDRGGTANDTAAAAGLVDLLQSRHRVRIFLPRDRAHSAISERLPIALHGTCAGTRNSLDRFGDRWSHRQTNSPLAEHRDTRTSTGSGSLYTVLARHVRTSSKPDICSGNRRHPAGRIGYRRLFSARTHTGAAGRPKKPDTTSLRHQLCRRFAGQRLRAATSALRLGYTGTLAIGFSLYLLSGILLLRVNTNGSPQR